MRDSVTEVGRVAAAEGIDADIAPGGTVVLARSPTQLARARARVRRVRDASGSTCTCSTPRPPAPPQRDRGARRDVHPALRGHPAGQAGAGLAGVVEARGARLFEQTPVTAIEPGRVRTARGEVRAGTVVRATEGYTARLPGARRALAPVYSLVVATEPLPDAVWDEIGLRERETFSDHRHLIIYGQRSADGRLVFGGRGAPYHFASRIRPDYDRVPRVFDALARTVGELFPVLRDVRITHRWGGPLGIARDWHASVGLDPDTRLAWAGGYVGDGVSTTNLAGRTLAEPHHRPGQRR